MYTPIGVMAYIIHCQGTWMECMTLMRYVVLLVSSGVLQTHFFQSISFNTGWSHQTVENLLENSDDVVVHLR